MTIPWETTTIALRLLAYGFLGGLEYWLCLRRISAAISGRRLAVLCYVSGEGLLAWGLLALFVAAETGRLGMVLAYVFGGALGAMFGVGKRKGER